MCIIETDGAHPKKWTFRKFGHWILVGYWFHPRSSSGLDHYFSHRKRSAIFSTTMLRIPPKTVLTRSVASNEQNCHTLENSAIIIARHSSTSKQNHFDRDSQKNVTPHTPNTRLHPSRTGPNSTHQAHSIHRQLQRQHNSTTT